jgi:hypothetical protein
MRRGIVDAEGRAQTERAGILGLIGFVFNLLNAGLLVALTIIAIRHRD